MTIISIKHYGRYNHNSYLEACYNQRRYNLSWFEERYSTNGTLKETIDPKSMINMIKRGKANNFPLKEKLEKYFIYCKVVSNSTRSATHLWDLEREPKFFDPFWHDLGPKTWTGLGSVSGVFRGSMHVLEFGFFGFVLLYIVLFTRLREMRVFWEILFGVLRELFYL